MITKKDIEDIVKDVYLGNTPNKCRQELVDRIWAIVFIELCKCRVPQDDKS
jgi:hypothetical protein